MLVWILNIEQLSLTLTAIVEVRTNPEGKEEEVNVCNYDIV